MLTHQDLLSSSVVCLPSSPSLHPSLQGAFPEETESDDEEVCFGDDAFDNIDDL